jgi:hypothetical protein
MALWTPATSGAPSLALWFDANDAASITHSSGAVSQWNDKSGNANHAAQATSGLKPTYDATAASNKGAIVFGAGSTQKLLDLTSTLSTGTAWTYFVVAKLTAQTTQSYILGGSGLGIFLGGNLPSDYGEYDGANIRLKTFATNPTIFNAAHVLGFSPSTLWTDGAAVASYEAGSANLTNSFNLTRIGSRPDQTTLFFAGELYELIAVPSTLTTGNRELYEGYLAWKWGLEGLLGAGHTYKSAAPTDGVGGSVSAALAVTDRPDTAAVNVLLAVQAALAVTDRPDTAAISADISTQAALAVTDRPDVAAIAADMALPPSVSFAITDRPDAAAINVLAAQLAALATTEAPDTAAVAANFSITLTASLATTDRPDTAALTASLNVFGPLATTEAPDTAAVSATFVVPLTVALAATDRPDGMAVDVVLLGIFAVEVAATDRPDSFHGAAWTYPWHNVAAPGSVWTDVTLGEP